MALRTCGPLPVLRKRGGGGLDTERGPPAQPSLRCAAYTYVLLPLLFI